MRQRLHLRPQRRRRPRAHRGPRDARPRPAHQRRQRSSPRVQVGEHDAAAQHARADHHALLNVTPSDRRRSTS